MSSSELDDELLPEYQFDYAKAKPNRFALPKPGGRAVVLEPDVAAAFPTAEAVNTALRSLLAASPNQEQRSRR